MDFEKKLSAIKEQISAGNLDQAIVLLGELNLTDPKLNQELILVTTQYQKLTSQANTDKSAILEKSRITNRLMQLVQQIQKSS